MEADAPRRAASMTGAPGLRHAATVADSRTLRWPIWTLLLVCAWTVWPRAPLDAWNAPRWGCVLLLLCVLPWWQTGHWRRDAVGLAGIAILLLLAQGLIAPDAGLWLWGSPQRSQGVLALGVLVLTVLWARGAALASAPSLGPAAAVAISGVAGLTLLQWAGFDPLRTGSERPPGTLGNPLLLGQWLVLSAPLAVLWGVRRSPWLGLGLALLVGLALFASGARGAWLGALGAALVWFLSGTRNRRAGWRGVLAAGLVLMVLAISLIAVRPTSVAHRGQLWQESVQALRHPPTDLPPLGFDPYAAWRPWLGWGLDAQALALRATRAQGAEHTADPDRAHQAGLDLLLRHGVLGCAWVLLGIMLMWRRLRLGTPAMGPRPPLQRALLAGLAGWLVSLQTGFAAAADGLTAALLIGVLLGLAQPTGGTLCRVPRSLRGAGILLAIGLWLAPPDLLPMPATWRGGERALIGFDALRHRLQDVRTADQATQCAALHASLEQARTLPMLDPTRAEYRMLVVQLSHAWSARCNPASQVSAPVRRPPTPP